MDDFAQKIMKLFKGFSVELFGVVGPLCVVLAAKKFQLSVKRQHTLKKLRKCEVSLPVKNLFYSPPLSKVISKCPQMSCCITDEVTTCLFMSNRGQSAWMQAYPYTSITIGRLIKY